MFDDTYSVYLRVLTYYLPSCTNKFTSYKFATLLVLRLECLSNVKVVFWHVWEYHNLQVFVSGYKLVT